MRAELHDLRYETAKKRSLGPSAFVETAKLERQVLAREKELAAMETGRSDKVAKMEAIIKKASTAIQVLIFLVYWGIPILSIDGSRIASSASVVVASEVDGGATSPSVGHAHSMAVNIAANITGKARERRFMRSTVPTYCRHSQRPYVDLLEGRLSGLDL